MKGFHVLTINKKYEFLKNFKFILFFQVKFYIHLNSLIKIFPF